MSCGIHITHAAENDLNEAADYIDHVLLNPDAAEAKIASLAHHALVDDPVLRQGFTL